MVFQEPLKPWMASGAPGVDLCVSWNTILLARHLSNCAEQLFCQFVFQVCCSNLSWLQPRFLPGQSGISQPSDLWLHQCRQRTESHLCLLDVSKSPVTGFVVLPIDFIIIEFRNPVICVFLHSHFASKLLFDIGFVHRFILYSVDDRHDHKFSLLAKYSIDIGEFRLGSIKPDFSEKWVKYWVSLFASTRNTAAFMSKEKTLLDNYTAYEKK